MTKDQAEKMIRNAIAQIPLPLSQHQQLQQAMNVLVTPMIAPAVKPEAKPKQTKPHNEAG